VMLALSLAAAPAAAVEEPAALLDLAGHQGMLAYRIVKDYCQIGHDVRMTVAAGEMKESIEAFEANLKRLKTGGVGEAAAGALAELEGGWPAVRDTAKAQPAKEKAEKLYADASKLSAAAEKLVDAFADRMENGRESQLYLVNRQRLLSQRLAALYMMQSWGLEGEDYRNAYKEVVAAFDEGLLLLSTAPNRPPLVTDKLKQASKKWEMMKVSNQDSSENMMPNMAIRMLDGILESIEAVAAAYLNTSEMAPAEAKAVPAEK